MSTLGSKKLVDCQAVAPQKWSFAAAEMLPPPKANSLGVCESRIDIIDIPKEVDESEW